MTRHGIDDDLTFCFLTCMSIESIQVLLKCILWLSFFSWVYKVYSCIDLKQMPTERLYAVDPGAPINVWIPVSVTFVPLKIK